MKSMKLGLCFLDENDEVLVKRTIGSSWSVDVEYDSKRLFDIIIKDEIVSVLLENLKMGLNSDVIKSMLYELESK